VYKLWLVHGVTTVREMGSFNGLGWMLQQRALAEENAIAAPVPSRAPSDRERRRARGSRHTREQARAWLRRIKERGADGVKFFSAPPALMQAALDECRGLGLSSGCHHAQMAVTRMNALTSAGWGLSSAEHYYGLPEALFNDRIVQNYPTDYDYSDEYFRFAYAGQTFRQAAEPGSAKWNEVLEKFLALDFTFVPTFTIYDANRGTGFIAHPLHQALLPAVQLHRLRPPGGDASNGPMTAKRNRAQRSRSSCPRSAN